MKKTNLKEALFAIVFITLFLITIYSALAEIEVNTYTISNDFYVTSAFDKLSVCECSTKFDTIMLTNTGTYDAIFTIKTSEETTGKVTFSENTLDIKSGESKDIFIYYNAKCASGSEDITFIISSNLGPQKEIKKQFTTEKCQNLQMWVIDHQKLENTTRPIMPCTEAKYNIGVKNVGTYTETYTISNNYESNTKYSANTVTLIPGQAFEFNATLKFDCSVYGDKEITFTAESINNALEAQLSTKLTILRAYDYAVSINNNYDESQSLMTCNKVYIYFVPVTIKNTATFDNNYTLSFEDKPDFVTYSGIELTKDNEFSLKAGEEKTLLLNIDTHKYRFEVKNETFSVNFKSELGDIEKSKIITLNLQPCYEFSVKILDDDSSKSNAKEMCSEYPYNYDVSIANNGKFTETILLNLEGVPLGFELSKNNLTLAPGQNRTIKLLIVGPETKEIYKATIVARISNGLSESDELWAKTYTKQLCHEIKFNNNKFRINYDPKLLTAEIENKGIVDGIYDLKWNEDKTNLITLNEETISLKAGEKKAIHFNVSSAGKKEAKYIGELTITEQGSDTEYKENIEVTLKDKSMLRKTFEYFLYGNVCRQFSLYELFGILIVVALIAFFILKGPHYKYKFWNRVKAKKIILLILLCVFLSALIFIILIAGLPKSHNQVYNLTENYTQLKFEMLENDKFSLDASKFFTDPDNNTLKYTVSESKHIKSIINGNIITFYPDYAWFGNESVIITASDSFGGYVDSPSISLIVKHKPGMTGLQWYNLYCWYVNLAIFLIILILIFLMFVVKQEKRTRKKK